jgi:aminoglycoside/choline kinase family phosphotransferase
VRLETTERRMSPTPRAQARLAWTRDALGDPLATLAPASADASFRSYWRTHSQGRSWIVMDAPPEHEDIRPWLDIGRRLASAGLNAPAIHAADAGQGFVLMSDLGNELYLPRLRESGPHGLYEDALDALFAMQTKIDASDLPPYDEARLVQEMELLSDWFLQRHLGFTPSCEQWDVVESAFRALVDNARRQEQVFVHRDYHSRNLLVAEPGAPGILDFQDAVRGPLTNDLVSLLRDCYVAWPEEQVYEWVENYRRRLVAAGITRVDDETFRRGFDLMGLQRHIKVLGIFCRLWYRDGKKAYLDDLPLVWRYTREVGRRYAETAPLIALIEGALGERDIRVPVEQAPA